MPLNEPSFTFGIEEEYHLVDCTTRDLAAAPQALMDECATRLGDRVSPEFLRSQIEVGTPVCRSFREAQAHLALLRSTIGEVAAEHGLAPMAASTHPFARSSHQRTTDKERYRILAQDLQAVGRRLVICGMHVHVAVEDQELRIDLMNQARYFLPHLLVLSTSSPFWEGEDTGLKSYRLSVFDELPRTGMPGRFAGWDEYASTVDVLVKARVIDDPSKIWWDLRPSPRFPTLEMRITDVCTRMADSLAIAALFLCFCRALYRLRRANQSWRTYPVFMLEENRWRAQRYGLDEGMVDFGKGTIVPYADLLDEILELIEVDALALDCLAETKHAREIVRRGTSAHRQLAIYNDAMAEGASKREALVKVVDYLIGNTAAGLAPAPGVAIGARKPKIRGKVSRT
jgi:carboxylate-amine ligase